MVNSENVPLKYNENAMMQVIHHRYHRKAIWNKGAKANQAVNNAGSCSQKVECSVTERAVTSTNHKLGNILHHA